MLLDESVSPSRAFQRLITRCEKKYFLTSFWHLGLLSLAKWPRVPLLLQSRVNRDSKWTVVNPLYILKSSIKSALFRLSSRSDDNIAKQVLGFNYEACSAPAYKVNSSAIFCWIRRPQFPSCYGYFSDLWSFTGVLPYFHCACAAPMSVSSVTCTHILSDLCLGVVSSGAKATDHFVSIKLCLVLSFSSCPHFFFLQIHFPGIPWSSFSSAALWCLIAWRCFSA